MFQLKSTFNTIKNKVGWGIFALLILILGHGIAGPIPGIDMPKTAMAKVDPFDEDQLLVRKSEDFEITGDGTNPQWAHADWVSLTKLDEGGEDYPSRFKILYSQTGIYVLFEGEDDKITTSDYEDMDKIWNGDVFEIFIHPVPTEPMYFEYEVNQFEKQLLLTISDSHKGVSWIPFNEYGKNTYGTFNKVKIQGGKPKIDGKISSWKAEVFLSFKSLGLLSNMPPKKGTVWNANFCRLDHDAGKMIKWSWTPSIESSLHELDKFRSIKFE